MLLENISLCYPPLLTTTLQFPCPSKGQKEGERGTGMSKFPSAKFFFASHSAKSPLAQISCAPQISSLCLSALPSPSFPFNLSEQNSVFVRVSTSVNSRPAPRSSRAGAEATLWAAFQFGEVGMGRPGRSRPLALGPSRIITQTGLESKRKEVKRQGIWSH